MGRLEALVVAALGRSPYDDDAVNPDIQGQSHTSQPVQLYDEKGRATNPDAKQYMKDQIRASNEVMLAAGMAVEKDDITCKAENGDDESQIDNFQRGYFRLGFGRMLLSDSIWGIIGLRRRVLLYRSYNTSIIDVLRDAYTKDAGRLITGAGLPAFISTQFGAYVGRVIRMNFRYNLSEENGFRQLVMHLPRAISEILNFTISVPMAQLRMFAILQQLGLISADRWFPSLRSFIPFTTYSPIQLPAQLALPAIIQSIGPVIAVYAYGKIHKAMSIYLEDQTSHAIPRAFSWSVPKEPVPLDDYHDYLRSVAEDAAEPSEEEEPTPGDTGREAEAISEESPEPEFVPGHSTPVPELRRTRYDRMMILTVMPAMLASENLSNWLGSFVLLPLELVMVNVVGRAYRRSAGLPTSDMGLSWGNVGNALILHMGEMVITGVLWAGYTTVVTAFRL